MNRYQSYTIQDCSQPYWKTLHPMTYSIEMVAYHRRETFVHIWKHLQKMLTNWYQTGITADWRSLTLNHGVRCIDKTSVSYSRTKNYRSNLWNRVTRFGRKVMLKTKQNGSSPQLQSSSFSKHYCWLRNYDRELDGDTMGYRSALTDETMPLKIARKIFKWKMIGKSSDCSMKKTLSLNASFWIYYSSQWLYDASDIIFPSVYMTEKTSASNRAPMVRGRIKESMRLSRNVKRSAKPLVMAYHRYKFTDTLKYLSEVCHVGKSSC